MNMPFDRAGYLNDRAGYLNRSGNSESGCQSANGALRHRLAKNKVLKKKLYYEEVVEDNHQEELDTYNQAAECAGRNSECQSNGYRSDNRGCSSCGSNRCNGGCGGYRGGCINNYRGGCNDGYRSGCNNGYRGGCDDGYRGGCDDGYRGGCDDGYRGGCGNNGGYNRGCDYDRSDYNDRNRCVNDNRDNRNTKAAPVNPFCEPCYKPTCNRPTSMTCDCENCRQVYQDLSDSWNSASCSGARGGKIFN